MKPRNSSGSAVTGLRPLGPGPPRFSGQGREWAPERQRGHPRYLASQKAVLASQPPAGSVLFAPVGTMGSKDTTGWAGGTEGRQASG